MYVFCGVVGEGGVFGGRGFGSYVFLVMVFFGGVGGEPHIDGVLCVSQAQRRAQQHVHHTHTLHTHTLHTHHPPQPAYKAPHQHTCNTLNPIQLGRTIMSPANLEPPISCTFVPMRIFLINTRCPVRLYTRILCVGWA